MSRHSHRYVEPPKSYPAEPRRVRVERSAAVAAGMADFQPTTVAAIRELLPRISGNERMALMEDLSADPTGCLQRILRTMRVGPALSRLIHAAIGAENREAARWSLTKRP